MLLLCKLRSNLDITSHLGTVMPSACDLDKRVYERGEVGRGVIKSGDFPLLLGPYPLPIFWIFI